MTRSEQNPYASPKSEPVSPVDESAAHFRITICEIILAWEKLRIAYLAWLAVVSLGMFFLLRVDAQQLADPQFWFTLVFGFFGANVCFTAGHGLEILLAALGMPEAPRQWLRGVMFVLGTLFATALTAAFVLTAANVGL